MSRPSVIKTSKLLNIIHFDFQRGSLPSRAEVRGGDRAEPRTPVCAQEHLSSGSEGWHQRVHKAEPQDRASRTLPVDRARGSGLGFCSGPSEPQVTDRVCLSCVLTGAHEASRLRPQQVFPDHPGEALRGPKAGGQALPPGGAATRDLLVPSELGYDTCKQSQTL